MLSLDECRITDEDSDGSDDEHECLFFSEDIIKWIVDQSNVYSMQNIHAQDELWV